MEEFINAVLASFGGAVILVSLIWAVVHALFWAKERVQDFKGLKIGFTNLANRLGVVEVKQYEDVYLRKVQGNLIDIDDERIEKLEAEQAEWGDVMIDIGGDIFILKTRTEIIQKLIEIMAKKLLDTADRVKMLEDEVIVLRKAQGQDFLDVYKLENRVALLEAGKAE